MSIDNSLETWGKSALEYRTSLQIGKTFPSLPALKSLNDIQKCLKAISEREVGPKEQTHLRNIRFLTKEIYNEYFSNLFYIPNPIIKALSIFFGQEKDRDEIEKKRVEIVDKINEFLNHHPKTLSEFILTFTEAEAKEMNQDLHRLERDLTKVFQEAHLSTLMKKEENKVLSVLSSSLASAFDKYIVSIERYHSKGELIISKKIVDAVLNNICDLFFETQKSLYKNELPFAIKIQRARFHKIYKRKREQLGLNDELYIVIA